MNSKNMIFEAHAVPVYSTNSEKPPVYGVALTGPSRDAIDDDGHVIGTGRTVLAFYGKDRLHQERWLASIAHPGVEYVKIRRLAEAIAERLNGTIAEGTMLPLIGATLPVVQE